jgi:hypothetical protein
MTDTYYASLTPEQKAARYEKQRARLTPDKQAKYNAAWRLTAHDRARKLALLKMDRPCYDCGGMFPPECMDWDHRPGTKKSFDVSKSPGRPLEDSLDEIAKCDLVCACCHRTRTQNRKP